MLSASIRQQVKATAPILKQHGVLLTSHFYQRMFQHNPELKNIFNQGHQHAGQQQQALAMAVAAYAEHIDAPEVLLPVLERVAHKHASLGIRAEHYPIVGKHLLASIREVLGEEAAPDSLLEAWAAAYQQLADLLIQLENSLYQRAATQPGGWSGWRPFRVVKKQVESAEITSFYLQAADGGSLPAFQPGQYISVQRFIPEWGLSQPRQYSLSDAPGKDWLRISVKREDERDNAPAGKVSGQLHAELAEGDILQVSPPFGDFVLHQERDTPVVLISAGVGQTPLLSMLQHLVASGPSRPIRYLHAARHGAVHAMKQEVGTLAQQHPQLQQRVFYETPAASDTLGVDFHQQGRIDADAIRAHALLADADYYLCGPVGFMQQQHRQLREAGVAATRIHMEVFGSNAMTTG
ncbi:NO-inducible flavohemoprotein [Aquitalea sp. LB_tupeE]|uniref:NO-inducible flavohemoprotein n=1 Tax=Aquitalea sp. LB_tupeE TaxID=2748078 RepID=UPI0015C0A6A6|nr:NO-inducible flavohemoprotein [Aquitalea sp. LB_tupeE]NWK78365.1 NO-inducible flavohemoprotein [Aquitalea sp. LB_tupeE]